MDKPVSILGPKHTLQAILRDTILGVEQVLLDLPQLGDKVEVTTTTKGKAQPGQRTTRDVVLPEVSNNSTPMGSTRQPVSQTTADSSQENTKEKAELVPGSVCVNQLRDMDGVMIEVAVKVTSSQNGSHLLLLIIECPDFVPQRLKCDNKWYNIV